MNRFRHILAVLLLCLLCAGCAPAVPEVRTDESIQLTFDRHRLPIYRIYNKALAANHNLEGRILFRITIAPEGKVLEAQVYEADEELSELAAAVSAEIYKMDFGKIKNDQATTFPYPMDFFNRDGH